MRVFVVDESQKFLKILRNVFARVDAWPSCYWSTVQMDCRNVCRQFPENTVIVAPRPGPPQMFFNGKGYTITTPHFALALEMLWKLGSTHTLDMVAILSFGPPTFTTAQQMRDVWLMWDQ